MQASDENLKQLATFFEHTLSADKATRDHAEQYLKSVIATPGFPIVMLKLLSVEAVAPAVRQSCAIHFKNFVKNHWDSAEEGVYCIVEGDRGQIKEVLVSLMLSVNAQLSAQLSEAISIIADCDYPNNWKSLLPELVAQFASKDFRVLIGVLQTASTLFNRYRHKFRSDELFAEIKYSLEIIQQPMLDLFKGVSAFIEPNASNVEVLKQVFAALKHIINIFYSLSCQDIPEFFEDHLQDFMTEFHKFLVYDNKLLVDSDEQNNLLHAVKAEVCECVTLYMERYEEQFASFLPTLLTDVWNLLMNLGLESRFDALASTSIRFLTCVSKSSQHTLFNQPDVLKGVCEKIIIPNVQFREEDEELFEDNPIDFLRRDIEGSDGDGRRRSTLDLIKGLCTHLEQPVLQLLLAYINAMLQEYQASQRWQAKDVAINVVIALAVKASTQALGVTKVNDQVDVMGFFVAHVLPVLEQCTPEAVNQQPVLKADCLKFATTFRNVLTKDVVLRLMPCCIKLSSASSFVVHSYAAIAIERFLSVREGTEAKAPLRYTKADILPLLESVLTNFFGVIETFPVSKENEYVMKGLMRFISVSGDAIAPLAAPCLQKILAILARVAANPTNPSFNHYLFETIASMIKNACVPGSPLIDTFETTLFPPFQQILTADITEFAPYVFQLLSQLLELKAPPLSQGFVALFPPLLSPVLWERPGNIPPLVRLLQAYLPKGPDLTRQNLAGILGVFQRLIASKAHDHEGFYILESLVMTLTLADLSPYLGTIFSLLFTRLQNSKTIKYCKSLLIFFSIFISRLGGNELISRIDAMQPKLFAMILQQIWIPTVQKVSGNLERKMCAVGMTKLLCETPALLEGYTDCWVPLLGALVVLFELPEEETPATDDDAIDLDESPEYSAAFVPLRCASKAAVDPFPEVANARQNLAVSLHKLSQAHPGKITAMLPALEAPAQQALLGYLGTFGVTLS